MAELSGSFFDVFQGFLTAGDSFDVDFKIQNPDFGSSGSFWVDFYLSDDDLITTADRFLGDQYIFSFDFLETDILTKTLTLPSASDLFWSGLSGGTYYVGMIVDSTDAIYEFDEFDNYSTGLSVDYDNVLISVSSPPPSPANQAPTNINLSSTTIAENQPASAVIGTLATIDPDAGDTHTYSLVAGTGGADNGLFTVEGNTLKAKQPFDFEAKSSYSILVQTQDSGGLTYSKQFTIAVSDINELPSNQAPTDISLSSSSIAENQPANAVIGTLSTTDADAGNTHTYSLVAGTGSTDNGLFTIDGNTLKANQSFNFEVKNAYSLRVQTRDNAGAIYEEQLTITVTDVAELPSFTGGAGNDTINGDALDNTITGNDGNDILSGYGGNDNIVGGNGNDTLVGGLGNDTLQGGEGDDALSGTLGSDLITGGNGSDRFIFNTGSPFDRSVIGTAQITDFTRGQDKIVLDKSTFNTKRLRFASVSNLREARTAKAELTYLRSSGSLFFNANGTAKGFGSGGKFIDLQDGLALAISDFQTQA